LKGCRFALAIAAAAQLEAVAHAQAPTGEVVPRSSGVPMSPPSLPSPQPTDPAPPVPPAPPVTVRGPVVTIITRPPGQSVAIQRHPDLEVVCLAPCQRPLDATASYRLAGGWFQPTEPFSLPRADGEVVVEAHMRTPTQRRVGLILGLSGLGIAAFAGSVLLLQPGRLISDDPGAPNPNRESQKESLEVVVGLGLAVGLLGWILNATGHSTVTVN
jgi:hypothetical protein